jgi:hypothetical protein
MKPQVELLIKQEIESVFGRRIVSSRDCIQLCDQIYERTKLQLNPNTLRRFFGLVKADYPPSHSTLTILSKYCGFQSVDEVNVVNKVDCQPEESQENILHFLVSLFRDVHVHSTEDSTFLSLVFNTVNFLNRNPALTDKFQIQIAKTKNGQEFYFEKFVNIDKLNGYYGNGLRYYYNEKRTTNAQVFGHSLMVFRYWLTSEHHKLLTHFEILKEQKLGTTVTPFIYGRYLAASIYAANASGTPAEDIIIDAFKYYTSIAKEPASSSFPRFELYLAEALILTGYWEEGLYYIEQAKKHYVEGDKYTNWKFLQNFILLESIALHQIKSLSIAEEHFQQINPSQFYFLRKSYSNILYLNLARSLKRHSNKQQEQLDALIEETGFVRLASLF